MKSPFKRIFLFSILILCSCSSIKNDKTFISDKNLNETGFYIISNPVPKKVVDYAKDLFTKENLDTIKKDNNSDLILSEPYSIKEKHFSFLILQNGKSIGKILIIKKENKLTYQISRGYFDDELNNMLLKNGIYELSFEKEEEWERSKPILKKHDTIPKNKIIYNIKNSIKKIKN